MSFRTFQIKSSQFISAKIFEGKITKDEVIVSNCCCHDDLFHNHLRARFIIADGSVLTRWPPVAYTVISVPYNPKPYW